MLETLGMTPEEFQDGFEEFLKTKNTVETQFNLLDKLLNKDGIPQERITILSGKSNYGCYYHEYVETLLKQKTND